MEIIWKDVPWYSNYEINNQWVMRTKPRIITPHTNIHWYLSYRLSKDWVKTNARIHRLVMKAFMWESKLDVNHIDWNKLNNSLDNLEYCTHKQNMQHAWATWLCDTNHIRSIKQYTTKGILVKIHKSIADAARAIWSHPSSISWVLAKRNQSCKWYKWKYT